MKQTPALGSVVCVSFWDHTQSKIGHESGPLRCHVWGKLVRRDKLSVEVRTWESEFEGSRDSSNHESYTIIRSTIESIYTMKAAT